MIHTLAHTLVLYRRYVHDLYLKYLSCRKQGMQLHYQCFISPGFLRHPYLLLLVLFYVVAHDRFKLRKLHNVYTTLLLLDSTSFAAEGIVLITVCVKV